MRQLGATTLPRHLLLFDVDGTLVDSQHDIVAAMEHAFAMHGHPPPSRSAILSIVGLSVPEAITALAPALDPDTRHAIATSFRAGAPVPPGTTRHDFLYPGALEFVSAQAARDVLLGIATGKSRRGVERLFDRYAWHPHFATVQTADTNPSKPHPGMIEAALADTGIPTSRAVMIGDTTFDMAMARAAGVRAIGVAWGYHQPSDLLAHGAETIVSDFAALARVVDTIG